MLPIMPTHADIQLVCFDLGRVLIRICDNWADACVRAGAPEGAVDPAALAQMSEVAASYELGTISADRFADQTAQIVGLQAAQVKVVSDLWLRGPYPGVFELMDCLVASGAATACLSNTNANHWRQMTTRNDPNYLPLDRLTYRFASHLIGHAKPAGQIYRHVEEITGTVPVAILFFDDDRDNVEAATSRGWLTYQIQDNGDPVAQVRGHLELYGLL